MNRHTLSTLCFALLLGAFALCACTEDTQAPAIFSCTHDGEFVEGNQGEYCVYEQAVVIETGFNCPPDMGNLHSYQDVGICSNLSDLPDAELEAARDLFRERHPTPTPIPVGVNNKDNTPDFSPGSGNNAGGEADPVVACAEDTDCPPAMKCNNNAGFCVPSDSPDNCLDNDGDGFCAEQGDCDDGDLLISPASQEVLGDGVDNDCDGEIDG